jgi:ankyrin repeat protein
MYWLDEAEENITPLEFVTAAMNGDMFIVKQYLEEGGDINVLPLTPDGLGNYLGALFLAVREEHPKTVEFLINNGADVDIKTIPHGYTPLMMAAVLGNSVNDLYIKLLLNAGADLDIIDSDGESALDLAKKLYIEKAIKLLTPPEFPEFLMEADETTEIHPNAALKSIAEANIVELKDLIKKGLDINGKLAFSYHNYSLLTWACAYLNIEIVKFLIANGANVNTVGEIESPLYFCLQYDSYDYKERTKREIPDDVFDNKNYEIIKILLENRAKITQRDIIRTTDLNYLKLLVQYGAKLDYIEKPNSEGRFSSTSSMSKFISIIDKCTSLGNKEDKINYDEYLSFIDFCIEKKAGNLNKKDRDGRPTLYYVVGYFPLFEHLLEKGAKLTKEVFNCSPYNVVMGDYLLAAIGQNNFDTADYLIQRGFDVNARFSNPDSPVDYNILGALTKNSVRYGKGYTNSINADQCRFLLKHGVDFEQKIPGDITAVEAIIKAKKYDLISILKEYGYDVKFNAIMRKDKWIKAYEKRDMVEMKSALDLGFNINIKAIKGETTLNHFLDNTNFDIERNYDILKTKKEKLKFLKFLLVNGAKPDNDSYKILSNIHRNKYLEVWKYLYLYGGKSDDVFLSALKIKNDDDYSNSIMKMLFDEGYKIDYANPELINKFWVSSLAGGDRKVSLIKNMLDNGVSPDTKVIEGDAYTYPVIHIYTKKMYRDLAHFELVKRIINSVMDINVFDSTGRSALIAFCKIDPDEDIVGGSNMFVEIFDLLEKKGADINYKANGENTRFVLENIILNQTTKTLSYVLDNYNFDLSVKNDNGDNILLIFLERFRRSNSAFDDKIEEMILKIISLGVDPAEKDNAGENAYDFVEKMWNEDAIITKFFRRWKDRENSYLFTD